MALALACRNGSTKASLHLFSNSIFPNCPTRRPGSASSADHDYGPCVQIFLPEAEFSETAREMMRILDLSLPDRFDGWPVRYAINVRPSAADAGAGLLGSEHGVELYTLSVHQQQFRSCRPEILASSGNCLAGSKGGTQVTNASIDLILPERLGPLRARSRRLWHVLPSAQRVQKLRLRLPAAGHRGSPFASCSARGGPGRCPPLPTDRMSAPSTGRSFRCGPSCG